jgi:serine/threonine-protein kinase RsbW
MSRTQQLEIAADLDNLKQARDFVEESTQLAGLDEDRTGELLLAVDEAVTNIVMHGCPQGGCTIQLEFEGEPDACIIRIRDDAPLFDPTAMLDPDLATSPMERDAPGGFGVYLFKHLVDQTSYRATPDGRNELTLLKRMAETNVSAAGFAARELNGE